MFAETDLSDDGFLGGRLRIWQPVAGYRAATDPVLLAAAVPAKPGESVLELGCGAGVASLCLGARVAGLTMVGLERQAGYADLARRNAARNDLPLEVVDGDLTQMPAALLRGFTHVIANPPWFPAGAGTAAADPGREAALREQTPLADWIEAATRRLSPAGTLTVIQQADRLPDLLAALGPRIGSVCVLPLAARTGRAASRIILQARKGGRAPFRLLAPLILHDGDAHSGDRDSFTPEVQLILRAGTALSSAFG